MSTRETQSTKNYSIFKKMPGNRTRNKAHVNQLERSFLKNGNLTDKFPIVVNDRMEIVDGQHRFAALKKLGWEVHYIIEPNLTIEETRVINMAGSNWSWKDYANSYASLGNASYKQFLEYDDIYKFKFITLLTCFGQGGKKKAFMAGELKVTTEQWSRGLNYLNQLQDIEELILIPTSSPLEVAFIKCFQNPLYDHTRMLNKLTLRAGNLRNWSTIPDYLRNIEDIYNSGQGESTQVRLF